jgi:V8-like Glu-specific endopeptidase
MLGNTISNIDERLLIDNAIRWEQVVVPKLYRHPHNCIGWMIITNKDYKQILGTGFLLSKRLVITSAHTFLIESGDKIILAPPLSFSIFEENQPDPRQIKVRNFRVNPEFQKIKTKFAALNQAK